MEEKETNDLGRKEFLIIMVVLISLLLGVCSVLGNTVFRTSTTTSATDNTSTSAADTPTPKSTQKPKPTPTPNPELKRIELDLVDCATRSYIPDYSQDHTQVAIIAASNEKKWSNTQNAIEGGKAVVYCLEKFFWDDQPDLQLVAVTVVSMTTNNNTVYVGADLHNTTGTSFDWSLSPDKAWDKYDDHLIRIDPN